MKKCTPDSLLEQILFPDQHKMTRSQLSSEENLYQGHNAQARPLCSLFERFVARFSLKKDLEQ
jgi:hypothetical protein